jgi:hypothetical protein
VAHPAKRSQTPDNTATRSQPRDIAIPKDRDNGNGAASGDGGNGQQQSGGAYDFTPKLDSPQVEDDCGQHAYSQP